jgi:DNA polymerase III gamma/tau subunit
MSVRLVRRGEGDLYRVYRPLRFGEFYGPTRRAAVPLVNQIIRTGRLEKQSYLISGFSGSGKTTLALTIAMALNCKNRQPNARSGELIEPCLVCDHCQRALSGLVAPLSTSALSFHNASSINKESVEDIINNRCF